ncbi:MAG: phosphotransferase, partial [Dehalococcoidia bacterium]
MSASPAVAAGLLDAIVAATGAPATYIEPPRALTGGRDTEVYALRLDATGALAGPLVARVFAAGEEQRAAFEEAVHRTLAEAGALVPAVVLHGTVEGRPFLLMERVPGKPAADCIVPPGRVTLRLPRLLAEAHAAIHAGAAAVIEALVSPSAVRPLRPAGLLARTVEAGPLLPEVVAWLAAHEPPSSPEVVCHGDYHPMNVLVDGGRVAGVIDWPNLQFAPPEYDVARSMIITADAPMDAPAAVAPLIAGIRRLLAARTLAAYRRIRPVDAARLDYYEVLNC